MIWADRAACRDSHVSVFFPPDAREPDAWHMARSVCAICPVQRECLDLVIDLPSTDDKWGMFGGLTPYERKMRRRRKQVR
jgi:hypothetical protein